MVRRVALILFAVWFIVWAIQGFKATGFVHVLLLCAVAVAVVQFVAERRAARQ